jgi:L-lysine exporter family protein LysE/ArgO
MITVYCAGLVLGFGLITPIGPQNLLVVTQGLTVGWPRALWSVGGAGICDTLLIVSGALGVSAVLARAPAVRLILLGAGTAYLAFLGSQALRRSGGRISVDEPGTPPPPVTSVIGKTVSVSLLNPHAVLDTVGVIGAAIASQHPTTRGTFAAGVITASWLWFLFLSLASSMLKKRLTSRGVRYLDRFSAVVMLLFAVVLAAEFVRALA